MRLKFLGELIELLLILMQIGEAYLQQLFQRYVDHFVRLKFFRERLSADAEIALRFRQQVGLMPLKITLQGADHGGVGLPEFDIERRIFAGSEGRWNILFEKSDERRQLAGPDF